jgi:dipeptidyl aminopeptidase/acylaminoacyl peptidase
MPEPLPLDAHYDLRRITDVALSPDGDRVAFTATEYDPDEEEAVASLFVVPTDGSRDPHRLTRVEGAADPRWSPSGDRLAFLAARETDAARRVGRSADGDGDDEDDAEADGREEPRPQVWLFDLALGGDARQVTDFEEGVRGFDWSPSGDRLAVDARDPTDAESESLADRREGGPVEIERLQHKVDGTGWTDDVTAYVFVVDVEDGEAERLDDAHGGGAFEDAFGLMPAWGPTDRIAFVANHGERPDATLVRDVFTIAPDGTDRRKETASDLAAGSPRWSPSGDRLGFVGRHPENWCVPAQLYVRDGDGYDSVTGALDRTLSWAATPEWTDDGALYTIVGDGGLTRPVRASVGGDAERVFDAQGADRSLVRLDVEAGTAALLLSHPSAGLDLYAVDVADLDAETEPGSFRRLTDTNAGLRTDHSMPACRRIEFDSDGWTIDALVYHDPDVVLDEGPHPLVVAIHGGPVSYDEPEFSFDHAALTTRGYVVLRVNYRGGTSRGREYAETLRGRWGSVEVDDVVAGVESVVERGWADPDRVFGHGFSYGGILQGYLVTQTDLLTAAAPEHGIYDLRSTYGTDDSHVWMENEYGYPWENADAIDASSAITDAGGIETPLLVMAGGEDWRCPPSQSEQLYVSARSQGVAAKLVVYPDENHDVHDPDRAIHRLEAILGWYERHDPGPADEDAAGEGSDR